MAKKELLSMANRIALTLVFALSFLSYMRPDPSESTLLVPLALFAGLVFFKVLFSGSILSAVGSLFELDGLLYVVFLSLLIIAPSLASGIPFQYALLISACLILTRLYLAVIPIREVLEAFFWSGILSVGIFAVFGFADIIQSAITLSRLWPFGFHPNLLAWELAGYLCVGIWKVITADWWEKILAGALVAVCLPIMFLTSSRSAIVGVVAGCLFAGSMAAMRAWKEQRKKPLRVGLLVAALILAFVFITRDLEWMSDTYAVADVVLSLSTPDRGIDSGLTGRVDVWRETIRLVSDGSWLLGHGMRSSDSTVGSIDNSYLVILYDLGLIPLILITWRFLTILEGYFRSYFQTAGQGQRSFCLACSLTMVVVLVTNLAERSLFAVGNPFSLLALFFFAAPTPMHRQVPQWPTN